MENITEFKSLRFITKCTTDGAMFNILSDSISCKKVHIAVRSEKQMQVGSYQRENMYDQLEGVTGVARLQPNEQFIKDQERTWKVDQNEYLTLVMMSKETKRAAKLFNPRGLVGFECTGWIMNINEWIDGFLFRSDQMKVKIWYYERAMDQNKQEKWV